MLSSPGFRAGLVLLSPSEAAGAAQARAFNPESPMVKMSPRCEFFLISANTATDRAAPIVAAEGVAADQADDASDRTSDFDCAASPARPREEGSLQPAFALDSSSWVASIVAVLFCGFRLY